MPLSIAAAAYGCTALATLSDNPGAAPAGSSITVSGSGFGSHNPTSTNGPVQIRLGSLTGPVLASAQPVGSNFSVEMTIPPGTPAGDTFIAATQNDAGGQPVFGTPARLPFTVTPSPRTAPTAGPVPSAQTAPSAGPVSGTFTTNATTIKNKAASKARRAKATAACKKKYATSKAKSPKAKKSMAHKRATCVKKASKS